jgi:hypothetical protein
MRTKVFCKQILISGREKWPGPDFSGSEWKDSGNTVPEYPGRQNEPKER